jgi:adenylate cyclase
VQLWAQSYERDTHDLLTVEKELAEAVVGSFATHQLRVETRGARRMSTDSLDAWGLVQKARSFVFDYTAAGLAEAAEPLRRAIDLDGDYAAAHATLASVLAEQLVNGFSADAARDERAAVAAAETALQLAPHDPFILKMVSLVWVYAGDHRRALNCLRKAVGYAPFDFGAWGYMGWPLAASAEPKDLDDLRRIVSRLLETEPNHPGVAFWLFHKSVADVCEGNFEAAVEAAEAAVEHKPALSLAWMHYANVLGQLKRRDSARRALEQCRKVNAAMTPKHFESLIARLSSDARVTERRVGGLRWMSAPQS